MGKLAKFGLFSVGITVLIFVLTFTVLRHTPLVSRVLLHDSQISKLNTELTELSVMYVTAPEATKPQISDIRRVATARRDTMTRLAHDDPRRFLANKMSDKDLEKIPSEVKEAGLVEEAKTVIGTLVATQLENFETHEEAIEYSVKEGEGEKIYSLATTTPMTVTTTQIGAPVTATGIAIGGQLVVENDFATNLSLSSIVSDTTAIHGSDRQVIIISFNFLNDRNDPSTNAELEAQVFTGPNSSKKFFLENSYGKVNLVGQAVGPFTIPFQKVEGNCYNYNQWAIAADTLAFASGVDINSYKHKIYSFPRPDNCWAGAWADIGGTQARVYIPGEINTGTVSHELGHNFGFSHANFQICDSASTQNQIAYTNENCHSSEYGDPYDTMGWSGDDTYRTFNAPHREQAGWMDPAQVQTVSTSGTYTIYTLNTPEATLKSIKIPMSSVDESYYIEYRQPTGFDVSMNVYETSGLLIHAYGGYATHLLDPNIALSDASARHTTSDSSRAVLEEGDTFVDSTDGVSITLVSHTADAAVIEVTIDSTLCQRRDPGITITPTSASAAINEDHTFEITVTNNDSAECAPGFYSASAYGENMINSDNSYVSVSELTPGDSLSFDLVAHFDYKSTLGDHKINAYASSANHNNQVSAIYTLTGKVESVQINPASFTTYLGDAPTHMSALAYDSYGRPVWTNLTYEWGMSSASIALGTLQANLNIADFIPLNEGYGDLFVVARQGEVSAVGGTGITVLSASPTASPAPSASPTASIAPSVVPSPSSSVRPSGDINHDGVVDQGDFEEIINHFGSPYTIFDYNAVVFNFGH